MFDRRHDPDLPPALRDAVAAWRTDAEAPDLAPAVLAALRTAPAVDPPARRWSHAAAALLAASLLIAAAVWFSEPPDAAVPLAADGSPVVPAPAEPVSPEPAPAPVEVAADLPVPAPTAAGPSERPSPRRDLLPADLFSPDRLAAAWEILPDPNRTWRDELRDGVRPFRAGAENVVTLFAEALPPRRRPY